MTGSKRRRVRFQNDDEELTEAQKSPAAREAAAAAAAAQADRAATEAEVAAAAASAARRQSGAASDMSVAAARTADEAAAAASTPKGAARASRARPNAPSCDLRCRDGKRSRSCGRCGHGCCIRRRQVRSRCRHRAGYCQGEPAMARYRAVVRRAGARALTTLASQLAAAWTDAVSARFALARFWFNLGALGGVHAESSVDASNLTLIAPHPPIVPGPPMAAGSVPGFSSRCASPAGGHGCPCRLVDRARTSPGTGRKGASGNAGQRSARTSSTSAAR